MFTFRHLRFLLRSAEAIIEKPPTIANLQAESTLTKGEVRAMQAQLAETVRKQNIDRATAAEEKDGRTNEG
jgi:hypothetical protein